MQDVLTVAMVAKHWGCSDTFVYDEIARGKLTAMRFGAKLIRIRREDVEAYEASSATVAPTGPRPDAPSAADAGRLIRGARSGPVASPTPD